MRLVLVRTSVYIIGLGLVMFRRPSRSKPSDKNVRENDGGLFLLLQEIQADTQRPRYYPRGEKKALLT